MKPRDHAEGKHWRAWVIWSIDEAGSNMGL